MSALVEDRPLTATVTVPQAKIEQVAKQILDLAHQLAGHMADVADADQWSVSLVGLKGAAEGEPEELFPEKWLQRLNADHPARYRMTLLLQAYGRPLGTVRLATIRPSGFSDQEGRDAQLIASRAGIEIADALDLRTAVESLAVERNQPRVA